jgi:3'-phosphoadenosine 5'-phosphosulfate sulfotransferase (PAPS reductase)/FAD synthetase
MVVVGMKYIASVSFGKDSLAMLLRLIEEKWPLDIVVFYDTGMEFESIYQIRDKVRLILAERRIEYIELKPQMPFLYSMLKKEVTSKQKGTHYGYGWCGGLCRWGTSEKLRAIKQFKDSLAEPVIDYVGIAADEVNRFEKSAREGKVLPLVEWGMSEHDCLQYCHAHGFYWIERATNAGTAYVDLYQLLDRVSCWCCCNKNLKELRNIYSYLPQYWDRLKILQQQIDRPFKGYYKGRPNGIFELEKRFLQEQL